MRDSDLPTAEAVQPRLWSPNAASNWSLLFTPAFGAYLHAANWRALGKPERAMTNMVWVWITVAFLAVNLGTLFVPESKAIESAMRVAGLGLLLGWYFSQGRPQAQYVKETLGNDYVKRGWSMPLLAGMGGVGAYVAVIFVLAVVANKPNPKDLANEVKPLILKEWQKKPELSGATIQDITLVQKGGNTYTGFVYASLGGKSEVLPLEVTHDGWTIRWQIKPAGN